MELFPFNLRSGAYWTKTALVKHQTQNTLPAFRKALWIRFKKQTLKPIWSYYIIWGTTKKPNIYKIQLSNLYTITVWLRNAHHIYVSNPHKYTLHSELRVQTVSKVANIYLQTLFIPPSKSLKSLNPCPRLWQYSRKSSVLLWPKFWGQSKTDAVSD